MKKYINLRTFMSLLYLLTFIILAILIVGFPQALYDEPTMLGAVLCGTNVGMGIVMFIDAILRSKVRK